MQFKQLVVALSIMGWGAFETVAMEHGEYADHNGLVIRYHQLARGVFVGVPADSWDDEIHQRSEEELESELTERNLEQQCRFIMSCAKKYGGRALRSGWEEWLQQAIAAVRTKSKSGLVDFLKSPFFANSGGVAIAGVISSHIKGQANLKAADCSTSHSEADFIGAAIGAAMAKTPAATEISVNVSGPGGTWGITLQARPFGEHPAANCT
ncbi:hypothetical protein AAE478_006801 [Parahypoxylon ruwenzoriense]